MDALLKFILSPIVLYPLAIILFAISFGLGSAFPLPEVWVLFAGIAIFGIINVKTFSDQIVKFNKNKKIVTDQIEKLNASDITLEAVKLKITHNKNASPKEEQENYKAMLMWLEKNKIGSLEDINLHLEKLASKNSTLRIIQGITSAVSMLSYTAGTALQDIIIANDSANTPETLTNFPTTALTGAGYGVMNLSQVALLTFMYVNYQDSKMARHILHEEMKEGLELPRIQV